MLMRGPPLLEFNGCQRAAPSFATVPRQGMQKAAIARGSYAANHSGRGSLAQAPTAMSVVIRCIHCSVHPPEEPVNRAMLG
jgi:hypothetical protein